MVGNKGQFGHVQASRSIKASAIADGGLIDRHLQGEPDDAFLDGVARVAAYPAFAPEVHVSQDEVEDLLSALQEQFHSQRIDSILGDIRSDLTRSIVGPFGLGHILAAYDKEGGHVDTVHNVRQGIYATEREHQAYSNRGDYDSTRVHSDRRYRQVNKETSDQQKSIAGVEDGYTGKVLKRNSDKHLDHIKSAKETHDDPARVLAELDTEDLANIRENLTPTDGTINLSKGAKPMDKFIKDLPKKRRENREKINTLESKSALTPDEAEKLRKLKKKQESLDAFDAKKAREADRLARSEQTKKINKEYYTSPKFAKSTLAAGASEGYRMGLQQAVGLVLIEFIAASFDETKRTMASVRDGKKVIPAVTKALRRARDRLLNKWKEAFSAFGSGFLSGFFSSLLTTLINAIKTTSARVVRLIREGVFSLVKALKVAFLPEKGVSFAESFHAATKLLFSGGIVIAGIALEEVVQETILGFLPMLGDLAAIFAAAIIGGFSTLAIAVSCYILDKIDFFGAVRLEESRFVLESLDAQKAEREERLDALLDELSGVLKVS